MQLKTSNDFMTFKIKTTLKLYEAKMPRGFLSMPWLQFIKIFSSYTYITSSKNIYFAFNIMDVLPAECIG